MTSGRFIFSILIFLTALPVSAKVTCGKPFEIIQFCKQVDEKCPALGCWDNRDSVSSYSEEEKTKAFETAKSVFERFVSNSGLQAMCCGKRDYCKERFAKTRLNIVKSSETEIQLAEYDSWTNEVRASEARILMCRERECLEQVFLHELGHACQYSRKDLPGEIHPLNVKDLPDVLEVITFEDFKNTLGLKTAECVLKGLREYAKAVQRVKPGDAPVGHWMFEAFANSIFSAWLTKPAHYYWYCASGGDAKHANPSAYLGCLFERAAPRRNICIDR